MSKSKRDWKDSDGSVSLEASMVFPWVLMITFLLVVFALFISQRALLYYSSTVMAERTAFSWSNSTKDSRSGAYPQGQYDGLYWRLTDDALVRGLFGLVTDQEAATSVRIDSEMVEGQGRNAENKLQRIGYETASVHRMGTGEIDYRNAGINRQIEVRVTGNWIAEPLSWIRGDGETETEVTALIVEPAEFIRSFDLVRYYASRIKEAGAGGDAYRDKAGGVLQKRE
ncbi:TadE family protein [Cohnella lupini]|uniref:TadE-like protein n=1 Tax=Cohnella lupini TaxID=1294267 RepID=A0A3D9HZ28_9BACL|nr:TadE family protein [Cohnella lupini]RED54757.1 hypothetical protein DFP95_12113 [Cohnella lupini]